ncbi:MAG TPA: cytochrome c oxidase subunit II [Myxococcales bacterium]|nr:cytochrome c oxidase subunit II [Myxococcales bacterium]
MFHPGMPPDWSLDGHRIDWLIGLANGLELFYFLIVAATLVTVIVLFRRRADRKATFADGGRRRDLWLTLSLAVLVFVSVDVNLELHANADLEHHFWRFPAAKDALRVEVMPQQWAWNFRYAGPDGEFGTADDVVTLNDLRIPVGRPILVQLQSKDVIHSFTLPFYRLKIDANPGAITEAWFEAAEPGKSEVACSQMCGWAHYLMRGEVTALPPAEFEAWVGRASANSKLGHDPDDPLAQWGWRWRERD